MITSGLLMLMYALSSQIFEMLRDGCLSVRSLIGIRPCFFLFIENFKIIIKKLYNNELKII